MKKFLYLILLCFGTTMQADAAAGDTTWVQAQAGTWLEWYGDYDTTVTLPSGSTSYRKIYLVFTLGKYACPGNPQYCSDWDYTVQTLWMTPAGDTFELARLITPYANSQRMTASWKGVYMFDVTDYYPVLKNTGTMRVHYSGYTGGFTADVKLAFIEGTPPRNVVGLQRVWKGSYNYGHGSVDINDALSDVQLTAPGGTVTAEAKFTITGHGGDAMGCAEFCPNTYTYNLNSNPLVTQNFWRADCGYNNYYPQNGTWIYDRAGWCPGDLVKPYSHTLTGITDGNNFSVSANFPFYSSSPSPSGSLASYIIESAVIYYGGFNHNLDASLDDIIAPTNFEAHFRENPMVGKPIIRVKNTGSSTITSLKIQYGVVGEWMPDHVWTGSIAPLEEAVITLPEPWSLRVATGVNQFQAKILEVNGQADQDPTNNELRSTFTAAPQWTPKLFIRLTTNNATFGGYAETSWVILNMDGDTVAQRRNNNPGTMYNDTLELGPAVYKLVVEDLGCDGLSWWANPGAGTGSFQVRKSGSPLPVALSGYYGGDFGCGFVQYFTTGWATGVENVGEAGSRQMEVYPNPSEGIVYVSLDGYASINGEITVTDALGKVVYRQQCEGPVQQLNLNHIANGLYTIIYSDEHGRQHAKVMISK